MNTQNKKLSDEEFRDMKDFIFNNYISGQNLTPLQTMEKIQEQISDLKERMEEDTIKLNGLKSQFRVASGFAIAYLDSDGIGTDIK